MENNNFSCTQEYNEKNFTFYDIEWPIDDFCLQFCNDESEVRSPELDGCDGTKFVVILRSTLEEDSSNASVFLVMKRTDSDAGPDTVWITWRLTIFGTDYNEIISCAEDPDAFSKGAELETYLINKSNLFRDILKNMASEICSGVMTVELKMIIYSEDSSKWFEERSDDGLKLLSSDLLEVFESGINCDIELKIGTHMIPAHRSILSARCSKLKTIIESELTDKESTVEVQTVNLNDFPLDSCEAMKKVLAYIYTGEAKHVLQKPSLSIYECILLCDLLDLKSYYSPEKLTFRSSINVQEFTFKWSIHNFDAVCYSEMSLRSHFFTDDEYGRPWQVHFYPRGDGGADNSSAIFLNTDQEFKPLAAYLDFRIEKNGNYYCGQNAVLNSLDCSKKFGFEKAFNKYSDEFPLTNTVNLLLKLRLFNGEGKSCIEKYCNSSVTFMEDENIKKLSEELDCMMDQDTFYNICFKSTTTYFKAHKCIIDARCDFLSKKCKQTEDIVEVDIESHIFSLILSYLYTGVVQKMETGDTVKLYKAAKYLKLSHLQSTCSRVLKASKEKDVGLLYEMLNVASDSNDNDLKFEILDRVLRENVPAKSVL